MTRLVVFSPGRKVLRVQKNLKAPKKALKQIGILLVATSQRAFRTQGLGSRKWAPRKKPNIFGIISDLRKGGTPKKRRFQTRPVLHDTGRLSGSIAYRVTSRGVSVGTRVKYGKVHQTGGETESYKISAAIQKRLAKWLKGQSERVNDMIGWLTSPKYRGVKLKQKVVARPFLGWTRTTPRDVRRTIGKYVMETK